MASHCVDVIRSIRAHQRSTRSLCLWAFAQKRLQSLREDCFLLRSGRERGTEKSEQLSWEAYHPTARHWDSYALPDLMFA